MPIANILRLTAVTLLLLINLAEADPTHYTGALSRNNSIQLLELDIDLTTSPPTGTYSIPELSLFDESLREMSLIDDTLSFRILYGTFTMHFDDSRHEMTGGNNNWGPPVALHLKRTEVPPRPTVTDTILTIGDIPLMTRLYTPVGPGPFPAIVVVPGSGDQGIDTWLYRGYAATLARHGVAAAVYDKRGVGSSTGDYQTADLPSRAEDPAAIIDWLKGHPRIDFNRLGLMGISQGGWISLLAANNNPSVSFVILNVGPAVPVWDQERHRVEYIIRADSFPQSAIDSALAYTDTMFASVGAPDGYARLGPLADICRAAPWGDYLSYAVSQEDLDTWLLERHDPAPTLKSFTRPLLALYGADDPLVPPAENVPLLKQYLTTAGNSSFEIVVFPDVGHNLEQNATLVGDAWDWPHSYWRWPRKPAGMWQTILDWVNENTLP